jgi:phosphohistidine phosphatase
MVSMKLYLVQHAEAKREEEDPTRPLSERGWKDIKKVADFLKKGGIGVSEILHSGKLRAKQTAEVLAENISPSEGVKEAEGLSPLDDPNIWGKKLEEKPGDVMLVGHLPHLSKLAGLLLTGDQDRKPVNFKMGGVVCLEKDEAGNWSVQWILIPQIL